MYIHFSIFFKKKAKSRIKKNTKVLFRIYFLFEKLVCVLVDQLSCICWLFFSSIKPADLSVAVGLLQLLVEHFCEHMVKVVANILQELIE